jgi:predicted amidohydrolase YtcJ
MGMDEDMELYRQLRDVGGLKARIFSHHDKWDNQTNESFPGDRWINRLGCKIFLDGSLGAGTAALSSPYSDAPSQSGMLLHNTEGLVKLLESIDAANSQVLIHAIGDAALDQLLDATEILRRRKPDDEGEGAPQLQILANHCMVCRPDQLSRMKRLDVGATIQPAFVVSDWAMASSRLGDRVERGWAYPWKNLIDAGVRLNGSSDSPADSINPWIGIWSAVNRITAGGIWIPEQRLTIDKALALYTINPATSAGINTWMGSLAVGKEADFVILDSDTLRGVEGEQKKVHVTCTVVGGRVMYGNCQL